MDLIDRQQAIDALKQQADTMSRWSERYAEQRKGVLTAVNIVEDLPPIQPKRGKWIGKYPVSSICSECGYLINDSKVKAFAFCPNCGAKMEDSEDEND